jgi:hypothetical protein
MEGRIGRGMFGTGKSAAFGIADVLRITTARNGKRSKVELKRSKIEKMKSDDPISVKVLGREVTTSATNGTLIEIENVHLRSLDQAGIIHYIERHLARWPKNTTVFVNNHECRRLMMCHRVAMKLHHLRMPGQRKEQDESKKTSTDEDLDEAKNGNKPKEKPGSQQPKGNHTDNRDRLEDGQRQIHDIRIVELVMVR